MRPDHPQPIHSTARAAVLLIFMPPDRAVHSQRAVLLAMSNSLQNQLGSQVRVLRIEKATHPEVVSSFCITQTPTFVLVREGIEIWRQEGIHNQATLGRVMQQLLTV